MPKNKHRSAKAPKATPQAPRPTRARTRTRTRIYAFEMGDSTDGGIGAVLRVEATGKRQALARARALADSLAYGTDLLSGVYVAVPGADSVQVYLSGRLLRLADIVDVEDDVAPRHAWDFPSS